MNEILTTGVLDAILVFIVGLFIKYGVPFIKAKWKEFWVNKAVHWAEQTIKGTKMGETRKAEVIKFLEKVGIVVDEVVLTLIEATVNLMNGVVAKK